MFGQLVDVCELEMNNMEKRELLLDVVDLKKYYPVNKTIIKEKRKYLKAVDGIGLGDTCSGNCSSCRAHCKDEAKIAGSSDKDGKNS